MALFLLRVSLKISFCLWVLQRIYNDILSAKIYQQDIYKMKYIRIFWLQILTTISVAVILAISEDDITHSDTNGGGTNCQIRR